MNEKLSVDCRSKEERMEESSHSRKTKLTHRIEENRSKEKIQGVKKELMIERRKWY